MKFLLFSLLSLFFNNLYSQASYFHFTIIEGKDVRCPAVYFNKIVYPEMNELNLYLLDFAYPKVKQQKLSEISSFVKKINAFDIEEWGNAGQALVSNSDTTKVRFTKIFFSRKGKKIDKLGAFTMVVERDFPYLIDTIIISDSFELPKSIKKDFLKGNFIKFPPVHIYQGACDDILSKFNVNENGKREIHISYPRFYFDSKPNAVKQLNAFKLPIKNQNGFIGDIDDFDVIPERFKGYKGISLQLSKEFACPPQFKELKELKVMHFHLEKGLKKFTLPECLNEYPSLESVNFFFYKGTQISVSQNYSQQFSLKFYSKGS